MANRPMSPQLRLRGQNAAKGTLSPRLRHRVTIEEPILSRDSAGEVVTDWQVVSINIPAEVVDLSGREFIAAASLQAEVTTRITIRAGARVQKVMRVIHDDRVYNIVAVLRDPTMARWLTLMCKEGVNDG